jgi:hypothetical protein
MPEHCEGHVRRGLSVAEVFEFCRLRSRASGGAWDFKECAAEQFAASKACSVGAAAKATIHCELRHWQQTAVSRLFLPS